MKSERRHELQTNSLAQALTNAPEFFRVHGSKVLLVVILILLAVILLYNRSKKQQEQLAVGWNNISQARGSIASLAQIARQPMPPTEQLNTRKQIIEAASNALLGITNGDNRQIAAAAYLAKGDLYWTAAGLPDLPEAATRPQLKMQTSSSDYLALAQEAWQKVVNNFADQPEMVTNAKFGLVAVAENKGQWDTAAKLLQEIKNDPKTLNVFVSLADAQLQRLEKDRTPLYMAPSTQPAPAPVPATRSILER
jgi:hypothetical protein